MTNPTIFHRYRPRRDLLHLYCGCCGCILNAHTPERCPNCRQPVDRDEDHEPAGHVTDDDVTEAGVNG